ncbi:hypothetical protein BKA70DRAFT_1427752 [Coprinopsis sp. MPI-PUGE-AT-0042]|nr:hypothetical protein BKA70DRAFT_1427752 [Coprinopsis sp. MPI-PUGE-AT-0042]
MSRTSTIEFHPQSTALGPTSPHEVSLAVPSSSSSNRVSDTPFPAKSECSPSSPLLSEAAQAVTSSDQYPLPSTSSRPRKTPTAQSSSSRCAAKASKSNRSRRSHSRLPKIMPLESLQTYNEAEIFQLSKMAEDMQYLDAANLWNQAGAPIALTMQAHLEALSLPDDIKKQVDGAVRHLDWKYVRDRQQVIASHGLALAEWTANGTTMPTTSRSLDIAANPDTQSVSTNSFFK